MKKIIVLMIGILLVGSVAAWEANPTYNPFEVLWNAINDIEEAKQERVVQTCPAGQSIRSINADGSVICEYDNNDDTLGDVGVCATGQVIKYNAAIKGWECSNDISGDGTPSIFPKIDELGLDQSDFVQVGCEPDQVRFMIDWVEAGTVIGFAGDERLSQPFRFYILLESVDDVHSKLGSLGVLSVWDGKQEAIFSGYISEIESLGHHDLHILTIVPEFDFLSLEHGYATYQNKDITDIIQTVMAEENIYSYQLRLSDSYETKETLTQYDESPLDFLERQMANEGIFYYFTHDAEAPGIVFTDTNDGFSDPVLLNLDSSDLLLSQKSTLTTKKTTLRAYDFQKADADLEGTFGAEEPERYLYLVDETENTELDRKARLYHLADAVLSETYTGYGHVDRLHPGIGFELDGKGYYPLHVVHGLVQSGGCYYYGNYVEAFAEDVAFKSEPVLNKQAIGLETAVVTGPAGENIFYDQYGRVKVQFHWDRDGQFDENSFAWIRVASPFPAIAEDDLQVVPRIGEEVVVAFEQGNPDRPIIIGSVYNSENMPPHPVGGLETNFNRNLAEGTYTYDGDLSIVADNLNTDIAQDYALDINGNAVISVGLDKTETVGSDASFIVGGSKTEQIGTVEDISVGLHRTTQVGGNDDLLVGMAKTDTVLQDYSADMGGNYGLNIGGSAATNVVQSSVFTGSDTCSMTCKDNVYLKSITGDTTVSADRTLFLKGQTVSIQEGGVIIPIK